MSEPDFEQDEHSSNIPQEPAPKVRLSPKLGLQGMILFIMELRLQGRMSDGADASETYALLTREDLERLEDVADTLEFFRLQRAVDREKRKK